MRRDRRPPAAPAPARNRHALFLRTVLAVGALLPLPGSAAQESRAVGLADDASRPPTATRRPAAAGSAGCDAFDPPLSEAAARLLEDASRPPLTRERVAEALRAVGSTDVRVRALRMPASSADGTTPAGWRRWMASRDAPLVCGEAADGAERVIVATARGGTLDPRWLPESRPAGVAARGPGRSGDRRAGGVLRGVEIALAPGFADPELVIEDAEGRLERRPGARGIVPLSRRGEPIVRIQLLARGPDGLRPVALWVAPGWAERASPRALPGASNALASRAPEAAIQGLRARAGLSVPLRPNRLLRRLARQQAERVCAAGRATHRGADGTDPASRLRDAGLAARVVGEVVARGAGPPEGVLADLLASPAHRAALFDPRLTDLGAAWAGSPGDGRAHSADREEAASEASERCLVVLLAAWPRPVAGQIHPPGG
jgi:hypothetical protein